MGRRVAFHVDYGRTGQLTVDHNTVFHTSNIVLIDDGAEPGVCVHEQPDEAQHLRHLRLGLDWERHAVEPTSRSALCGGTCLLAARPRCTRRTTSFRTCRRSRRSSWTTRAELRAGVRQPLNGVQRTGRTSAPTWPRSRARRRPAWRHDDERGADREPGRPIQWAARTRHRVQRRRLSKIGWIDRLVPVGLG